MELFSWFVLHPERIAGVAILLALAEIALARGWRPSRSIRDHGLLLAAAAWGVWAVWELLILLRSPEANIRIDLLLLIPLVLVVTVVGIVLEARRR